MSKWIPYNKHHPELEVKHKPGSMSWVRCSYCKKRLSRIYIGYTLAWVDELPKCPTENCKTSLSIIKSLTV